MACSNSPITELLPELLTLIFNLCLPNHTWEDPGPGISHNHPSVVLSHVCQYWRQVVVENSQSWSEIYVSMPGTSMGSCDVESWIALVGEVTEKVTLWLERTGGSPISLLLHIPEIRFRDGQLRKGQSSYRQLLKSLFSYSKQMRTVDVRVSCDVDALDIFSDILLDRRAEDLAILQSLSIHTFGEADRDVDMADFTDWITTKILRGPLFSSPCLRRTSLSGQWDLSLKYLASNFGNCASMAHLIHLAINHCHMVNVYDRFNGSKALILLEACPSLIEAAFVFQFERSRDVYERKIPITLLHLERLHLGGVPMGPVFARSLLLPSLKSAYLVFSAIPMGDLHPSFIAVGSEGAFEFIRKFGPQLSQAAINPYHLTPPELTACLKVLDGVELLSLVLPGFPALEDGGKGHGCQTGDPGEIHPLEARDCGALEHIAKPSVLPNLHHLEMNLWNETKSGRCERALVDLIAARRRRTVVDIKGEGGKRAVERTHEIVGAASRICITNVHVAFYGTKCIDVVHKLDERGIDLDIDPFNLRIVYPGSSGGLGTVPARPWAPLRLTHL